MFFDPLQPFQSDRFIMIFVINNTTDREEFMRAHTRVSDKDDIKTLSESSEDFISWYGLSLLHIGVETGVDTIMKIEMVKGFEVI